MILFGERDRRPDGCPAAKMVLLPIMGGLGLVLSAPSAALAQNCITTNVAGSPGTGVPPGSVGPGAGILGQISSATAAQISASTSNTNTVFQAGQGSAFVASPANPPLNSPGGGVWARATGGSFSTSGSSVTQTLNQSLGNNLNQTTTVNCDNRIRDEFAGFQIGADTARLNWGGWNIHLGTTAGYLESDSESRNNAFRSNFQAPFVGTYLGATYGRFFADALLKKDFYNISLDNPGLGFFQQPISGHGLSIAVNAGYNAPLANNWFIEPSAGFTWSRSNFDAFTAAGMPGFGQGALISGTVKVEEVTSEIGRASIRIGTTTQLGDWTVSPFVTASIFHEFAGDIRSNFTTCVNCNFFGGGGLPFLPASFTASTTTTRIGTYGQYSAGFVAQLANTGWLGFARFDYRNGENIHGWAGTAGIRYHFVPEAIAAPVVRKGYDAPVAVAPRYVNWTGFYIGGHGGVAYDRDRIGFVGAGEETRVRFGGLLGGGQVGYNYQFANNFVVGVEGDASWADLNGARTCGVATGLNAFGFPGGFSPFFMTCNTQIDWLATATGKIGYAWDRTFYYVKGGAAFTDEAVAAVCILGPFNVPGAGRTCNNQAGVLVNTISTSGERTGWTVGFGTKFALNNNWSVKSDYDYIDFGTRRALASDGTTLLSSRANAHVVKVGLDYRFSFEPVPAMARP